jgi:ATP-dependent DNA ligase
MMPTLVDEPPEGDGWIHEIKYDGYRTILAIEGNATRAFTRAGHDWTRQYHTVVAQAAQLPCDTAILDGEMVVQDEHGRADFHAMRAALSREPERLAFFAFDLPMLDGHDLRNKPLHERRPFWRTSSVRLTSSRSASAPTFRAAALMCSPQLY